MNRRKIWIKKEIKMSVDGEKLLIVTTHYSDVKDSEVAFIEGYECSECGNMIDIEVLGRESE